MSNATDGAAVEEKATPKKSAKTAEKAKTSKPKGPTVYVGPLMYVGPTVPGIGVQNVVYTEIPTAAKEKIAQEPEIGNLFIPVGAYPEANRMLREQRGYIFSAYAKALKIKGGR